MFSYDNLKLKAFSQYERKDRVSKDMYTLWVSRVSQLLWRFKGHGVFTSSKIIQNSFSSSSLVNKAGNARRKTPLPCTPYVPGEQDNSKISNVVKIPSQFLLRVFQIRHKRATT